jgi:hypothetical protein
MKKIITYPCIYALSAGMGFGPILIPKAYCTSEEKVINYTLKIMKTFIRNRAVIRWDEKGNKKPTRFWRDENANPYLVS